MLPHVKQTPLQLIVFSIFMLFVLVPNGATSFCSLRLISKATKQNGMGHTTTSRGNLMNLVLSSSWVNKITVSALNKQLSLSLNFRVTCVYTFMRRLKKNIMLYQAYILDSERGRCSNILTPEPEPREHNRAFQFSSDLWPDAFKQLTQRPSTEHWHFSDFLIQKKNWKRNES